MLIKDKVKKDILKHRLIVPGDHVILGLSGGPDSVALLHILNSLQSEIGFRLQTAHFNHQLRRGSKKDQAFVQSLTKILHIPLTVKNAHSQLRLSKGSLEEKAREQRLSFFLRLAKKVDAPKIALAHTLDDLAETVLMRLLRGSGLQGLRAILPIRNIQGVDIIRPILNIHRIEVLNYLKKDNIHYRVDPTNAQTVYFRNKVRHKLLPLLQKEYNPNIQTILANLSVNMTTDYAYLESQTQKIFQKMTRQSKRANTIQIELKKFCRQPRAIQHMIVRKAYELLNGNTNRLTLSHNSQIDDLISQRPDQSIVHLPNHIYIRKEPHTLMVAKSNT